MNKEKLLMELRIRFMYIARDDLRRIMEFVLEYVDPPFANELDIPGEYYAMLQDFAEKNYTQRNPDNGHMYPANEEELELASDYAHTAKEKLKKTYQLTEHDFQLEMIKHDGVAVDETGLCRCDCGTVCPLGKSGMETRCTVKKLKKAGIKVRTF